MYKLQSEIILRMKKMGKCSPNAREETINEDQSKMTLTLELSDKDLMQLLLLYSRHNRKYSCNE